MVITGRPLPGLGGHTEDTGKGPWLYTLLKRRFCQGVLLLPSAQSKCIHVCVVGKPEWLPLFVFTVHSTEQCCRPLNTRPSFSASESFQELVHRGKCLSV